MAQIESQQGRYFLGRVLVGYLLAIAIASLPLALMFAALFGVDIPVDEGKGRITGDEAASLELSALLIGGIFAFAVTFLASVSPFVAMLLVAKRFQIHGWRFYAFMWSASAAALLVTLAILFAALVHPHHPMPIDLLHFFSIMGGVVTVFWGLGGLAYWGYARQRPPISDWRAGAALGASDHHRANRDTRFGDR